MCFPIDANQRRALTIPPVMPPSNLWPRLAELVRNV